MANRPQTNNFIKIVTILILTTVILSAASLMLFGIVTFDINRPYNSENYEVIDIPKVDSIGKKIIVNDQPKRNRNHCKHTMHRKSIIINCSDSDHIEVLVTPKAVVKRDTVK